MIVVPILTKVDQQSMKVILTQVGKLAFLLDCFDAERLAGSLKKLQSMDLSPYGLPSSFWLMTLLLEKTPSTVG